MSRLKSISMKRLYEHAAWYCENQVADYGVPAEMGWEMAEIITDYLASFWTANKDDNDK